MEQHSLAWDVASSRQPAGVPQTCSGPAGKPHSLVGGCLSGERSHSTPSRTWAAVSLSRCSVSPLQGCCTLSLLLLSAVEVVSH